MVFFGIVTFFFEYNANLQYSTSDIDFIFSVGFFAIAYSILLSIGIVLGYLIRLLYRRYET